MRFSLLFTFLICEICVYSQRPFKEVKVDLDAMKIDSIIPVEDPFYLTLISANPFTLNQYKLLRVRTRKSYVPFRSSRVLLYKNIPLIGNAPASTSVAPQPTKVTVTNTSQTAAAGPTVTTSTVSEYPSSPTPVPLNKNITRIYIEPLTPNFYYYLILVPQPALQTAIDNGTLTKSALNLFDVIRGLPQTPPLTPNPVSIPMGHTVSSPIFRAIHN